jgi:hypothetical protein
MKAHRGLWTGLCWTGVMLLLNAALATCFGYEPKIENEPEEPDTASATAVVDSVAMPIFKQDSLTTTTLEDSAAAQIPTELTFSDSALADTLYAKKTKKDERPIYKKGWFIALVGGVIAATIIAIVSGGDGEDKQDLPEFPDPPDR